MIQYNEYYPYGLRTSNSWTREQSENNFLYNGGTERNASSGYYDLFYRNYDPAIGRFVQVDPMAVSEIATYQYSGNNPVMFNDPLGDQYSWKRIQWEARASEFFRESARRHGGGSFGWNTNPSYDGQIPGYPSWMQPQGIGSGNNWANSYSNPYRDYAFMSPHDFATKYGTSMAQYGEALHMSNNDWGAPTSTGSYYNNAIVSNKFGSWIISEGTITEISTTSQMQNRDAWMGLEAQQAATDEFLRSFLLVQFQMVPGENGLSCISFSTPPGYTYDGKAFIGEDGRHARGITLDAGNRLSDVYITPSSAQDLRILFLSVGHELIHVNHNMNGLFNRNASEYGAYEWTIEAGRKNGLTAEQLQPFVNELNLLAPYKDARYSNNRIGIPLGMVPNASY